MSRILRFKKRSEWDAVPPLWEEAPNRPVITKAFFWCHTPTFGWAITVTRQVKKIMKYIQKTHMEKFNFSDIAFHYVIADDGHVYEGRDLNWCTPDALKFNPILRDNRIDIALMGDYREERPLQRTIDMAFKLTEHLVKNNKLHKLYTFSDIREELDPTKTLALEEPLNPPEGPEVLEE